MCAFRQPRTQRLALTLALAVMSPVVLTLEEDVARAQSSTVQPGLTLEIDKCPDAPDLATEARRRRAEESYRRGDILYVQGDYQGASQAFITAYCLVPFYSVLKDVGQSFERLLDYERAIAYLERYVAAVPNISQKLDACSVPPAVDKQNVKARIQVLAGLPARISVASSPDGAAVTLSQEERVVARGVTGGSVLEARAGRYRMLVELAGFESVTRDVELQIGKPYSFNFALVPRRGKLEVRAEPASAVILVDGKLVGLGEYKDELPRGSYRVEVSADGRISERRQVEVRFGEETKVGVRLPIVESSGRTQLLVASAIGGAFLAGYGSSISLETSPTIAVASGVVGASAAAVGSYFGIPKDLSTGTSSLIITATIAGGFEGAFIKELVAPEAATGGAEILLGFVASAAGSAVFAPRLNISAGDAALVSSGGLWGGVLGGLFAVTFDAGPRTTSGLALTGLNVGLASGALIGRSVDYSRGHVALIDLAGVAGLAASAALGGVIDRGSFGATGERRSHYALGGITLGLLAGAYLTRNLDDDPAPQQTGNIQPQAAAATDVSGNLVWTFGLRGLVE